ncbi:hypothetical protein P4O66_007764 [Electrophorus voltai]|uniref:Uncharacterized protein n=1 Tax=Electrophorus voltai TaxID=2609070 RepID=A0AAD9DZ27_9TELE|nr:hypothetical protein P4O66_007764 [Electrophorus voltai]
MKAVLVCVTGVYWVPRSQTSEPSTTRRNSARPAFLGLKARAVPQLSAHSPPYCLRGMEEELVHVPQSSESPVQTLLQLSRTLPAAYGTYAC